VTEGAGTGSGSVLFVDAGSPRSRRPLDAAAVVGGLVLLVVAARAAEDRGVLGRSATTYAESLPDWARPLFNAAYVACAWYVLVVALVLLASLRERAVQALSVAVAAGAALAGATLASLVVDGRWPELLGDPSGGQLDEQFPVVGVAVLTAALLVLRPWMVISYRRLDAVLVGVLGVSAWLAGLGDPAAVLGAVGLGACAAGAVLLGLGSTSSGRGGRASSTAPRARERPCS
jgi:hypothetical protein